MRIIAVLLAAFAVYWFILRPILRRWSALGSFYARADLVEAGLLTRLRLTLKGMKTKIWSNFLMVAGGALPLLSFVGELDPTSYLPAIPIGPWRIEPSQYQWAVLAVIGWVTLELRKATSTPIGESDFALASPVVGEAPVIVEAERPVSLEPAASDLGLLADATLDALAPPGMQVNADRALMQEVPLLMRPGAFVLAGRDPPVPAEAARLQPAAPPVPEVSVDQVLQELRESRTALDALLKRFPAPRVKKKTVQKK